MSHQILKIFTFQSIDDNFDGIDVRIYRPTSHSEGLLPAVVYIHGGGWTVLSVGKMSYQNLVRYVTDIYNILYTDKI